MAHHHHRHHRNGHHGHHAPHGIMKMEHVDWVLRFGDIKAGKVPGLQITEVANDGKTVEAVSNAPVMNGEKFMGGRWVVDAKHIDPGQKAAVAADVKKRNEQLPAVKANLNAAPKPPAV